MPHLVLARILVSWLDIKEYLLAINPLYECLFFKMDRFCLFCLLFSSNFNNKSCILWRYANSDLYRHKEQLLHYNALTFQPNSDAAGCCSIHVLEAEAGFGCCRCLPLVAFRFVLRRRKMDFLLKRIKTGNSPIYFLFGRLEGEEEKIQARKNACISIWKRTLSIKVWAKLNECFFNK